MRLKLFSDNTNLRRKLFSDDREDEAKTTLIKVICQDCGHSFLTGSTTSSLICPKCGGDRVNVVNKAHHAEYEMNIIPDTDPFEERRRLFLDKEEAEKEFQKSFAEPSDSFELNLKRYTGKSMDNETSLKLFGIPSDELVERGFAETLDEDKIRISDNAYLQSKLFSKLIISVTKVLDLDPKVTMCGNLEDPLEKKLEAIDDIEGRGGLTPKGIILIRRAHNIIPATEITKELPDGDHEDEINSWTDDSGILNDLKLEFGGSEQDLPFFKRTLKERYPDAPTSLIDLLTNRGAIKLDGARVRIL